MQDDVAIVMDIAQEEKLWVLRVLERVVQKLLAEKARPTVPDA